MAEHNFDPAALEPAIWDQVAAAITVLDLNGIILYYNAYAPKILDRKPEYLGHDVCGLHQAKSATKIKAMLEIYRRGEAKEFAWQTRRDDKQWVIRLTPLMRMGRIIGALHTAMLLP
jgi:DUF438 domain-containing protein